MSSFLFYSSPPPAPYQPQQSFFTPQATRSNIFATSYSQWSSFQPKSPSPLRSSPNTGNLMRRQNHHGVDSKHIVSVSRDENSHNEYTKSNAQEGATISNVEALYGVPASHTDQSITAPKFTFNAPVPTSTRDPFAFQQRARESSAPSQVSSRISSNRDTRKAGFIDRLRRSRHDERDARGLDSFEKAEYWRDRREREMILRREAAGYDIDTEVELLDLEGGDDDEAELSPIDDETEVAELVDAFYRERSGADDELMSDDFGIGNEDDYDEAFLEMMSQEQKAITHPGIGLTSRQDDSVGSGMMSRDSNGLEGDMDVS